MRITKKQLRDRVEQLQRLGFDISISWAYGRPRCYDLTGARELSPRLRTGEMDTWISGFTAGVEAERRRIRVEDAKAGN